jgi:hypothetical protein
MLQRGLLPTTTATDNVDGDISANITSTYSSSDAGSAVTDRASARTHLGTVGNTVTVTYTFQMLREMLLPQRRQYLLQ